MIQTPNKPNQESNVRTGRPVLTKQQSALRAWDIEKVSCLTAKVPVLEQRDLFPVVCKYVFVERSDQDKDADENVDPEHVRTMRTN